MPYTHIRFTDYLPPAFLLVLPRLRTVTCRFCIRLPLHLLAWFCGSFYRVRSTISCLLPAILLPACSAWRLPLRHTWFTATVTDAGSTCLPVLLSLPALRSASLPIPAFYRSTYLPPATTACLHLLPFVPGFMLALLPPAAVRSRSRSPFCTCLPTVRFWIRSWVPHYLLPSTFYTFLGRSFTVPALTAAYLPARTALLRCCVSVLRIAPNAVSASILPFAHHRLSLRTGYLPAFCRTPPLPRHRSCWILDSGFYLAHHLRSGFLDTPPFSIPFSPRTRFLPCRCLPLTLFSLPATFLPLVRSCHRSPSLPPRSRVGLLPPALRAYAFCHLPYAFWFTCYLRFTLPPPPPLLHRCSSLPATCSFYYTTTCAVDYTTCLLCIRSRSGCSPFFSPAVSHRLTAFYRSSAHCACGFLHRLPPYRFLPFVLLVHLRFSAFAPPPAAPAPPPLPHCSYRSFYPPPPGFSGFYSSAGCIHSTTTFCSVSFYYRYLPPFYHFLRSTYLPATALHLDGNVLISPFHCRFLPPAVRSITPAATHLRSAVRRHSPFYLFCLGPLPFYVLLL